MVVCAFGTFEDIADQCEGRPPRFRRRRARGQKCAFSRDQSESLQVGFQRDIRNFGATVVALTSYGPPEGGSGLSLGLAFTPLIGWTGTK